VEEKAKKFNNQIDNYIENLFHKGVGGTEVGTIRPSTSNQLSSRPKSGIRQKPPSDLMRATQEIHSQISGTFDGGPTNPTEHPQSHLISD
jgi:hypothetical protein